MTDPLGPDIRALRKSRGMTLQALATALDRSVGWLSQVERGQTTPAIPDLARIAEVFGLTISFFFRSSAREAAAKGVGAWTVDGKMIDAPVLLQAQRILARVR